MQLRVDINGVRLTVERCMDILRFFCERDAYLGYDRKGMQCNSDPNSLSREELTAVNGPMRARSPIKAWQPLLGRHLPELEPISTATDLIESPEREYEYTRDMVHNAYHMLTSRVGITDTAASKMLYLKRPRLIAVSDSYIRELLAVQDPPQDVYSQSGRGDFFSRRGASVMDAVRTVGQQNTDALDHFQSELQAWELQGKPVSLSKARIVDILLWSVNAVKQHPMWRDWWSSLGG